MKNYFQCSSCGDVFSVQSMYGQFPSLSPCCGDTEFRPLEKSDVLKMKERESLEMQKKIDEILV